MNINKIGIALIGILALCIGIYFYLERDMLGFPDGHMSSREENLNVMYLSYIGVAAVLCVRASLIFFLPKGPIGKREVMGLLIPFMLFLLFIFLYDQLYLTMPDPEIGLVLNLSF
ncbi:MAG: hypothetical protein R8P61_01535 [Bacteroidia bacterium]|nr:hypothetical protein [Bacteroidia bacterium]